MATFNGSSKASFYAYLRMEIWENSKNVAGNSTNIGYKLSLVSSNGWPYASGGSYPWSIKDNGVVKASGTISSYNVPAGGTYQIATGNFNVTHNNDGAKWCDFYAEFTSSAHGYIDVYGGMHLVTIARASTPTLSASTVDYGGTVTVYTNRASTDFTHNMWASFSGEVVIIGNSYTTSATFTVPLGLMDKIPNATTSWGTIYVDTYSGPTFIGTKTVVLNTTVPASVVPTITSKTQAEAVAGVFANIGGYVQGISKVNATLAGAGTYSSTITSYEITIEGKTYTEANVTSALLSGSGSSTITYKVTDSRGRTATGTNAITILAYAQPTLTSFSVVRKDGATTTLQVERSGTFSHLTAKNQATMAIYTKLKTATDWGTAKSSVNSTTGSYSGVVELTGYADTSSYDIKIVFYDEFTSANPSSATLSVGTAIVPMSWSRTGIGAGKVWEQGALDVGGDAFISGNLTLTGTGGNVYTTSKKPTPSEIGAVGMPSEIPSGADLNNYQTAGMYYCPANATVLTISNRPTDSAFSLLIEKHAGIRQTVSWYQTAYVASWTRNFYGGVWGTWEQVQIGNIGQIALSLENGCSNFNDAAGTYAQASVMKNSQGLVVLQGLVKGGTKNMSLTTLPSGWRPAKRNIFIASTDGAIGRLDILPDGKIIYVDGNTGYISLSGLCFYANR